MFLNPEGRGALAGTTSSEKIEFLRNNPIFWSRLGWGFDPPVLKDGKILLYEDASVNIARHKAMYEKGILIHSSILPTGWVGVNQFDYRATDEILYALFKELPDIAYLPRIKLNVPMEWCKAYPEDVFVNAYGPRTAEEIRALVGTPRQDLLGFDSPGGEPVNRQFENRENFYGKIGLQSFSSERWLKDAGVALKKLVTHLENSPFRENIIGYHIAYGCCGETTVWGSWERDFSRRGDFGMNATKNFLRYAKKRGAVFTDIPSISERYGKKGNDFKDLFYVSNDEKKCTLYSEFVSDANARAIECFCDIVKCVAPQKLAGAFYGYIVEVPDGSHAGHLAFDKVLSIPSLDFISSPKGYYRVDPCGPGFGQAVPNSVNRKKLWIDEIDNRTHLYLGDDDSKAKTPQQTRGVYWREFTKNAAFRQGFWWMDLGGGWLDDEFIRNEIAFINSANARLAGREYMGSESEVLLVIDENTFHHMRVVGALHSTFYEKFGSTVKECGAPIDFYRLKDLEDLDLSKYKIIFFMNAFCAKIETLRQIVNRTAENCRIVWNYAAGIFGNEYNFENIKKLTGFNVKAFGDKTVPGHEDRSFPMFYVDEDNNTEVLKRYRDGEAMLARRQHKGRVFVINALPTDITAEDVRGLLEESGVHCYAPIHCTIHCDNRFLYIIAGENIDTDICFPRETSCVNLFTGERFYKKKRINVKLGAGTGAYFEYLCDK